MALLDRENQQRGRMDDSTRSLDVPDICRPDTSPRVHLGVAPSTVTLRDGTSGRFSNAA